jgi:hypothetical protein
MTDFPAAHLVASATASSIGVALQDRTGAPATLTGLEARVTIGAHLVSNFVVTSAGFSFTPLGEGLVGVEVTTPVATGRKVIGEAILIALTTPGDPRIGLGLVSIT